MSLSLIIGGRAGLDCVRRAKSDDEEIVVVKLILIVHVSLMGLPPYCEIN
jgi:hypothetical protein